MRIACIAFTRRALSLAQEIADALVEQGDDLRLHAPHRLVEADHINAIDNVHAWAQRAWTETDALLFVSACGIATRAIAPLVGDKFCDPAVVCVDETAQFAIPLLSGHVGGANELALRVATACGAQPVITTATDARGVFAVDVWAREQGLVMLDRAEAKRVSAELLEGCSVGFSSDVAVDGELPDGVLAGSCETGFSVSYGADRRPFVHTLRLVPHNVVVGIGCKRETSAHDIECLVDACLEEAGIAPEAVCALASIDVKADEKGLLEVADSRGWEKRFYSAEQLAAVPGEFCSSEFVRRTVGVDNVCERAACVEGAKLVLARRSARGVTVALAATEPRLSFDAPQVHSKQSCPKGTVPQGQRGSFCPKGTVPFGQREAVVLCVGLGPGGGADLTLRAQQALESAEVIVGYTTYVNLIRDAFPRAEFITTGMRGEVERCRAALKRAAAGSRVAVVCSGDPGVYGMAGLLFELQPEFPDVQVEVVPGVSAANGGAAVLGAPLMHDWCTISLSDLMTPWSHIEKRLRAAAQANFCIALYNPASRGRADHLRRACDVLLEHKSSQTVCGLVRNIGREGQTSSLLTLEELRSAPADMLTCVFVGNAHTKVIDGRMVTPRGYRMSSAPAPTPAPGSAPTRAPEPEPMPAPAPTPAPASGGSVLVFGGTTEGRELVEWLSARQTCDVVYCAATKYGVQLAAGGPRVTCLQGPLSQVEKDRLMDAHDFVCVVDATHPYAQHISQSIEELAAANHKDVVRIVRGNDQVESPSWTPASTVDEAARIVAGREGNVLLTTGTKDLEAFVAALPDYGERLYVRILPVGSSLSKAEELGIPPKHIVAMQGPFSTELNCALMRDLHIVVMVTKQSGSAGGFEQKVDAARLCDVELVVIERPHEAYGVSLEEAKRQLESLYGI